MRPHERRRTGLPFGLSWEKIITWAIFAGIVYALRSFFLIVFLTFIMSYMVQVLVTFLSHRAAPAFEDHWSRKPLVLIIYLASLAAMYLAAQSIIPRAIGQGRLLLNQIQATNFDQMRDEILTNTIGRIELTRYKASDREKYAAEFKVFVQEKLNTFDYESARRIEDDIRTTFEDQLRLKEGQLALKALKLAPEYSQAYKDWLLETRAEAELVKEPKVEEEFNQRYDEWWRLYNGESEFQTQQGTEGYQSKRRETSIKRMSERLRSESKYMEDFEDYIVDVQGRERVLGLPDEERDQRFEKFYDSFVPRKYPDFPLNYEQFKSLADVKDHLEFRRKFELHDDSEDTAKERFDSYLMSRLSQESSFRSMLGDGSSVMQNVLGQGTSWLTNIITNVLSFGLDALFSLMFSFMIVWEIPRMRRSISQVKGTRAERIYNEIVPGMYRLGIVVGTAFSAQVIIAVIEAVLMGLALMFLNVPSVLFLSLLTLVCCLVPYVGTVFAAVPIVIVALQQGGPSLAFSTSIAIFTIHELEAWFLSPKILGDFLQLSPVTVIFVLFLAQQLFGLWGLVLGVPLAVFMINDVMLKPVGHVVGAPGPIESDTTNS